MNPDDSEVAKEHMAFPEFVKACQELDLVMPPFKPIKDGDAIDLGGLTLDVISLPGHTPGGICLLLKEGSNLVYRRQHKPSSVVAAE
jgi:glyoxylase-like metal-dependent hydrolase (beta-lactamase superfamily II)